MALLELEKINKSYKTGDKITVVHKDFNLSINKGELVAVTGKSGCGKTTLLNILAGIDFPDSGKYFFDGNEVIIRNTNDGIRFRQNRIGMILQHFALVNEFSVYENIELGLWESKLSKRECEKRINEVLERLDIIDLKNQYPTSLSGGEKQRTAIGRAIVANPLLVLADEPTGSLDGETEKGIIRLINDLNKKLGMTFIIVTHDIEVANCCDRIVNLKKL